MEPEGLHGPPGPGGCVRQSVRCLVPASIFLALLPFLLHGLAREVDRGLGLVLRAEMEPAGLLGRGRSGDGRRRPAATGRIVAWVGSAASWSGWAWAGGAPGGRERRSPRPCRARPPTFAPLFLRPALTLLALASVALRAVLSLRRSRCRWRSPRTSGSAQDAAALAALAGALRLPPVRIPAPGARAVFLRLVPGLRPADSVVGRASGTATRATSPSTCAWRWPSGTTSPWTPRA